MNNTLPCQSRHGLPKWPQQANQIRKARALARKYFETYEEMSKMAEALHVPKASMAEMLLGVVTKLERSKLESDHGATYVK